MYECIVANRRIHPMKAAIIIKGVLQGLAHLHADSIVHRDMKTENIVLGETRTAVPILDPTTGAVIGARFTEKLDVKVIDFGLVKYMNLSAFPSTPSPGCFETSDDPFARATSDVFDNTPSSAGSHLIHKTPGLVDCTPCGTEIYCALEVLDGIVNSGLGRRKWQSTKEQLPKFDVYGAGTALYCMINGRPPFRVAATAGVPMSREERLRRIRQQVANGPAYWTSSCPPAVKEFIEKMLRNTVRDRPTASGALRDPLMSGIGDTFTYEVLLNGTIQNASVAPVASTVASSAARSAPISTAKANAAAADSDEALTPHPSEDDNPNVSDLELDRGAIDDIMAVVRGEEDDGDANGKQPLEA